MQYFINDACSLVCKYNSARGSMGHALRKFLKINSYKIESGDNFSPAIMVIAMNAHYVILCILLRP